MKLNFNKAVPFWINRVGFLIRKEIQRRFLDHGYEVTPEEWAQLLMLWGKDGQTPGELADQTIRDRTTITRLLDAMVRKDLVYRENDEKDRRVVRVWLTQQGKEYESILAPIGLGLIKDATSGISDEDIEVTIRTLKKMTSNLRGG